MRYGEAIVFFFNDTATTEIYTLSLHDALPICSVRRPPDASRQAAARALRSPRRDPHGAARSPGESGWRREVDRKSTRLNSSHANISYAVFCLKKKNQRPSTLPSCDEHLPCPHS